MEHLDLQYQRKEDDVVRFITQREEEMSSCQKCLKKNT